MRNYDLSLFDNLIEGVSIISTEFKYLYINKALANQGLNLSTEDIGKGMLEKFPFIVKSEFYNRLKHCMKNRCNDEFEGEFELEGDQEAKWLNVRIQPFPDGLLIMSSDISEKKRIANELERRKEAYRMLFKKMHEVFLVQEAILNEKGELVNLRLLEINEEGARELGKKPEELIGKLRTEYLGELEEGEIKEMIEQVIFENKSVMLETYLHLEHRWLQIHSYAPQPNQIASLVIDITKQKEYEIILEKLNHQLQFMVNDRTHELAEGLERERKLSETKSSFLSMAAHELKTPLGAIKLSVNVLERINEHSDTEERKKYHGYILEEANNLLQLLDRFIAPSHQEIGANQLKYQSFNLSIFLENIVQEFQEMCKAGQFIKSIYVGENIVLLDKSILRRIIVNLLNNAIKYSDYEITIKATVQNNKVIIQVIDKGIGIPKADQEKMFTQYFRAENVFNIQGTGLGLSIVKTYVELLEGTISFESKEHRGTTFRIVLPY